MSLVKKLQKMLLIEVYDGVQGWLAGPAELVREAEAPGHLQLGPLHQHSYRYRDGEPGY